jgi:hypothetical protein
MNVYAMTKEQLFTLGCEYTQRWLEANQLHAPGYRVGRLAAKPHGSYGCGYYSAQHKMVLVDPAACAVPAKGAARQWSFPAYAIDRTPVGVVAHEVGHHVDAAMGYPSSAQEWQHPLIEREHISGYEPNASERWAETLRLFILNPALLRRWRPRRYSYLTITLGLLPSNRSKSPLAALARHGASVSVMQAALRKVETIKLQGADK